MNEEQKKSVAGAYGNLKGATVLLQKAVKELAKFGKAVPALNSDVTKMLLDEIKEIDFNIGFVKSFMRVSVLQQLVPEKAKP